MKLVVAEKPSVARDLARVLRVRGRGEGCLVGDDVVITWCVGHLLELEEPGHYDPAWKRWSLDTLPMIPDTFALRPRKSSADQYKLVRGLLRDRRFRAVVNACDAGREGELIFRQVYAHAGCKLPVERLWVSSMTDEALSAAWARLQPGARFDALGDAAACRSEADWLVGLNATRAMTCVTRDAGGDALWSIGRVQTPTLAMIVARDAEIDAFVPETYWTVRGQVLASSRSAAGSGSSPAFEARWTRPALQGPPTAARGQPPASSAASRKDGAEEEPDHAERLASAEDAARIVAASAERPGVVAAVERQVRRERPPLLYDLTSLQRRANQRFGFSAQQTLDLAQALYERHKVITYPRTDARHLTGDQLGLLPGIVAAVGRLAPYAEAAAALLAKPIAPGPRVVDDAEVGDHHAILPTERTPDPARLSPDEKRIYDLVARRLLAALSPDAVIDLAAITVHVAPLPAAALPDGVDAPLVFVAKGRVVREAGWRAIDPPGRSVDVELPAVEQGEPITLHAPAAHEAQTRPPRPYDDASVLRAMETAGRALDDAALRRALRNAGLGTPATRAAILQTLIARDYVVRDGRALRATAKGRALIEALPVDELRSAELTARWEKRLSDIAEGRDDPRAFLDDVKRQLGSMVDAVRGASLPEAARVRSREPVASGKALGPCPACGQPVRKRGPVYTCDTGRGCPFVVYGEIARKKLTLAHVKALLKAGRTEVVEGFTSKAGKPFAAALRVDEAFKVVFDFPDRPRPSAEPAAPQAFMEPVEPVGLACPRCGIGRVIEGRAAWGCSRWRDGCTFTVPFEEDGARVSPAEAARRVMAQAQRHAKEGSA